jgi:MEMO1 family protein
MTVRPGIRGIGNDFMRNIYAFILGILIPIFFYAHTAISGDLVLSGIRPPAVADQFYPSDPAKLKLAIRQFFHESVEIPMDRPIAVIVPHAGYIYSGQICADAFLQARKHKYDTVVILGVNHTTGNFRGISLGDYAAFSTPLGEVPIDRTVAAELLGKCSECSQNREVHSKEHSIEVQIPFIQSMFPQASIVPVIIHPPDIDLCTRFGEILAGVLKNRNALIVISSDLSHYPTSVNAMEADRRTLKTISELDTGKIASLMQDLDLPGLDTRACGEAAILAGITAAKRLGATRAVVTGYSNSGEAAIGDSARAVGYGAVVLIPGKAPSDTRILDIPHRALSGTDSLQDPEKKLLLSFVRKTIGYYLTTRTLPLARYSPALLNLHQGVFVTLKSNGRLRGCIGRIIPEQRLGITIGTVALQAALNDPRFRPVNLNELDNLEIEISLLTPIKPVADPAAIVPGRDGVLLSKEGKSAVFLPQVAPENNWSRKELLDNLCLKAGLPAGCWQNNAKLEIFQAEVFSEHQFK